MNLLITIAGWFAWNAIIFRIDKDQYDEQGKPFNLKQYSLQSYDNWIASAGMIPILLWVGSKGLGIPGSLLSFDIDKMEWSDFYYLLSGFVTEAIIFAIKKWKASRK